MNKVFLSLNDVDLGYLTQSGGGFEFVAHENNILLAENENPIVMKMFKLNKSGKKIYSHIPEPFSNFLVSNSRKDLIEKANIDAQDCNFVKLFKLASLNMMQINFKIHQ